MTQEKKTDLLIIGGGILGLAIARAASARHSDLKITIIEKEREIAQHASGRNSGVLHAGFYYTADSLKAQFTVAGNRALRAYCEEKGLPLNRCGKLVVAKNAAEVEGLRELEKRGRANGSEVELITLSDAEKIEPNIKSCDLALYSPLTATVDPVEVCRSLETDLKGKQVEILTSTAYTAKLGRGEIQAGGEVIRARKIVNCAGLYADKIAHDFGFGKRYTIMPFKGLYLKYKKNKTDVRTNIYPVPNLKNPFLGVHFTKTVSGDIKIGPTAIPAFWRENYNFINRFSAQEALEILAWQSRLFLENSFNFRELAFEEMRKYSRSRFIAQSKDLVKSIDENGFGEFTRPGIRAQLLEKSTRKLVQDFVVEGDAESVHVLNAVSPAFTCSFPFAEHVVEKYI